VNEYLDSKRLRQVLSDSSDEMHRVAGVRDTDEHDKVVPVFVFDLDHDRHLPLDRHHLAVAFRDTVIAVRTRSSQTVRDYSCNDQWGMVGGDQFSSGPSERMINESRIGSSVRFDLDRFGVQSKVLGNTEVSNFSN
jgi:hypothetical protein